MTAERVIAVVIGRGGSKGLPRKNVRSVAGRPLIAHAIAHAQSAEVVDRVVVSTDDDELAAIATAAGVDVVRRPEALAHDTAPVVAAVRHAIESCESPAAVIVVLYANVPVRPADLIDRAVRRLDATGADSVQSYADVGKHHPYWMITLDEAGRVAPFHPNRIDRRQDLPPLRLPDGGVIAVTRDSLLESDPDDPHAFLGADRRGIETDAGAVVDVDDLHDLQLAEAILTNDE